MAKLKTKKAIPSVKEIQKKVKELIHQIEYDCIDEKRKPKTTEELTEMFAELRDVTALKLRGQILDNNMTGSCALLELCERSHKFVESLNDNKGAHTDNQITISFASKSND